MTRLGMWTVIGALLVGVSGVWAGEASALPDGMKGFKGQLSGTITQKSDASFVLKVDKVVKVWTEVEAGQPGSTAKDPQAAVGKELTITIGKVAVEKHTKTLAGLAVGDKVLTSAFNLEGGLLTINEVFEKVAGEKTEAK